MDGVLADFEARFFELWTERFPNRLSIPLENRRTFRVREDYPLKFRRDIEGVYGETGFFANLNPVLGATEALNKMSKLSHLVFICTSPLTNYQNCVDEKYGWVDQNLGSNWVDRMILTRDKTLIQGDILIDDRPEIKGLKQPSWEHILFDQPYNREIKGKRRLNWQNYREVLGI